MKKNKIVLLLFLLLCLNSFAQTEDFRFKRKLENTSETWHKIVLPEDLYAKLNTAFSDIRIFGNGNTVEAPYVLKTSENQTSEIEIPFQVINVSSKNSAYFYTFELSENKQINQIKLDFSQENFDWKINLEGSNNQSEWFSIVENYRILSIKNSQTEYQFTQVDFPTSKYKFYRLNVKANEQPKLTEAKIWEQKKKEGDFKISKIKNLKKSFLTKEKVSVIEVELAEKVPVSSLKINVSNQFDYYRPIKIEVLNDSIETEKGWHYNYEIIAQETLSSLEKEGFLLGNKLAKKIRISIENGSNQPLEIKDLEIKNAVYFLLARFTEKATYNLFYGNLKAQKPTYDIENFQENIPKNPIEIKVENEEANPEFKSATKTPLFENKIWLWVLMGIIILVLGYFSLKMLKE